MRRRLNLPLALGLLLVLMQAVMLILPAVVDIPSPSETTSNLTFGAQTLVPPFRPGEAGYLLGSDRAGRDLLSLVILGARATLGIGVTILVGRVLIAVPLGLAAGWRGGWMARVARALSTGFSAFPNMILLIFIWSILVLIIYPNWIPWFCALLIFIGLPRLIEQVRVLTAHTLTQPFIETAVAAGASPWRILTNHVLPVIRGDLGVTLASEMSGILVLQGQLPIFGMWLAPRIPVVVGGRTLELEGIPEWGMLMGFNLTETRLAPWIPLVPAAALALTIACFHLLAEGMRLRWLRR